MKTITLKDRVETIEDSLHMDLAEGLERRLEQYIPRLSEKTRHEIAAVILTSCSHCWSNDAGCQCWNDE